jgi:hypothetical protein
VVTGGDGGSKLVMKGSPVRVRASAPKSPAKRLLVFAGQETNEVLQTRLTRRFERFHWFSPPLGLGSREVYAVESVARAAF